jgi:superfamily II RNA helicase
VTNFEVLAGFLINMPITEKEVDDMYCYSDGGMASLASIYEFQLKKAQKQVIMHLLNNKSVFALLPTGSGKTICYSLLPTFQARVRIIRSRFLGVLT